MASQNGRCNCGAVTVSLAAAPPGVVVCHCFNCRRAGGPCSLNYVVPEKDITIKDSNGSLKAYEDADTRSGRVAKRHFCSTCGSPVYTIADDAPPGNVYLKASLFEEVVPKKLKESFLDTKIQGLGA